MEWQPIETAPKDGTVVLLANWEHLAAGYRDFRIELDWKYLGYDEGVVGPFGKQIGPRFSERVPNPDAGKRHEWWSIIGCTAFLGDTPTCDFDGSLSFSPTHWMPLPAPPKNDT